MVLLIFLLIYFSGDPNPRYVGRKVILSSPFTGSPQQILEFYQDSICLLSGNMVSQTYSLNLHAMGGDSSALKKIQRAT